MVADGIMTTTILHFEPTFIIECARLKMTKMILNIEWLKPDSYSFRRPNCAASAGNLSEIFMTFFERQACIGDSDIFLGGSKYSHFA